MRLLFLITLVALSVVLVSAVPRSSRSPLGLRKAAVGRAAGPGVLETVVRKRKSKIKLPKSNSGGEEEEEEDEETVDQQAEEVLDEAEDAINEAEEAFNDARDDAEDFFSCFPASASVVTEGGHQIRMEDLAVGDRVAVGAVDSPVFMFTHADRDGMHPFVQLRTTSGHALSLSAGHYLYANGALKRADSVIVGEKLRLADGASSPVVDVRWTRERGLYNPQTLHGDIAVNGVVASTYTAAVEPKVAHALLAPARLAYTWIGYSSSLFNNGVPDAFRDMFLPIGSAPA